MIDVSLRLLCRYYNNIIIVLVWIQFIPHSVDSYVSPEELKTYRVVTSVGDEEDSFCAIEDGNSLMHVYTCTLYMHVILSLISCCIERGAEHYCMHVSES